MERKKEREGVKEEEKEIVLLSIITMPNSISLAVYFSRAIVVNCNLSENIGVVEKKRHVALGLRNKNKNKKKRYGREESRRYRMYTVIPC